MMFLYDNSKENPYHLSVGALLRDPEQRLLTLRRPAGFIILPTGTIKPGERLDETLPRELLEETGAEAKVTRYLGATLMTFRWGGRAEGPVYHKAVLWHELELISIDESRRAQDDDESDSSLIWLPPSEAIEIFQRQGRELGDWDFSEAVSRLS